jgi:hypothetical protein
MFGTCGTRAVIASEVFHDTCPVSWSSRCACSFCQPFGFFRWAVVIRRRIYKHALALVDRQILIVVLFILKRSSIFHFAEVFFDLASLVADLCTQNADVLAGPAFMLGDFVLGQLINRGFFFHRFRSWGGCRLRCLFGIVVTAASG